MRAILDSNYMTNPYSKLLLICDVAEQFIADSKNPDIQEDMLKSILGCLLSAEDILDKGRSIIYRGATAEFAEDKRMVNERMEAIRSEIVALMKRIGKSEVTALLDSRANRTRAEWVQNL